MKVALFAAPALFILPGAAVIAWTTGDWTKAFWVALRSYALTSLLLVFTLRFPPSRWLGRLRAYGVPPFLADLLIHMHRCIQTMADTAQATVRSQTMRLGYVSLRSSQRSSGLLAARLFRATMEKARRQQIGLDARGDRGELRVLAQ
jgi:cobalt/nickel transport system permease protein